MDACGLQAIGIEAFQGDLIFLFPQGVERRFDELAFSDRSQNFQWNYTGSPYRCKALRNNRWGCPLTVFSKSQPLFGLESDKCFLVGEIHSQNNNPTRDEKSRIPIDEKFSILA